MLSDTIGPYVETEAPLRRNITHNESVLLTALSIKYNFSSQALALTSGFESPLVKSVASGAVTVS